ncbi:hypothetical protein GGS20DRAFT_588280 [Poronia punctata]|nr:hypothetical protein GGS20DRAFT_588280 [Poronia punctata]
MGDETQQSAAQGGKISQSLGAETSMFNEQGGSTFFGKLPLEIRNMVYAHKWSGAYDNMYHEPRGRHLHFKDGHWLHTRCVMAEQDDKDIDLIQAQMDLIHNTGQGDLLAWQRRLASTWGHRHWRCEERVEYGKPTAIDRTDLGALMVVCKKIHHEVMQSFVQCHKLMFNDLYSAYRFLVQQDAPHLLHSIRHLDLTLSVPFHELIPFITSDGPGATEKEHDGSEAGNSQWQRKTRNSQLGAVLNAVADRTTCLHSLRVSLDVYDRGPWRKVPESALAPYLERPRVRPSKTGSLNYTVELPAALPIRTHYAGMRDLEDSSSQVDEKAGETGSDRDQRPRHARAFDIVRRQPLRYWQFNPGQVERFTWKTRSGSKERRHCWIVLNKGGRVIPNPYLIDFTER